jgi:acetyl coenzyme A synthetase (ADP forming)-like protein
MLNYLFNPQSVAVIGASREPKKVGYAVVNNLVSFGYKGDIYPINPSAGDILGKKAFPSVSAVGREIDLVVVSIPARLVADALKDCAKAKVKAAVVLSAGFKEIGHEGIKLEQEMLKIAADNGIRIMGPNCLGVINTSNNMNASFAADMLAKGNTALFSQSGALGVAIMDWALENNFGFSKFISLGNKSDLNEVDFLEYFIDDPETGIIIGYIEDVVDGKRFMEVARRATRVKPVALIKSGGTEAGARAASSHTGALAGSETAFNAAFKQTGIMRAMGIQELFDTALAFSGGKLPKGDRLLIITNAGGPGIIAADTADKLKIKLPPMTKETIDSIADLLPSNASLYNPVDIIGDATSERYRIVLEKAITDPNVDGVLVLLTPQAMTDVDNISNIVVHTSKETEKPIIASFIGGKRVRSAIEEMKAHRIPSFAYPEVAIRAFRRLCEFQAWRNTKETPPPQIKANAQAAGAIIESLLHSNRFEVGEDQAMRVLSHYGFTFPERALAKSAIEAGIIAERIGFPVVMKISSPDILHKTDVGGVKLNINSAIAAEDAFNELTTNARRFMPDAYIEGVMIYEMIKGGKEVIMGVTYDRTFGHMIMFGLGGIYVEVLKDVSFRIAPVSHREATEMVNEIRSVALLKGARGDKPVDMEAIVDGILRISRLVTDFPIIREIDVNPMLVMQRGAFALDARIIFDPQ